VLRLDSLLLRHCERHDLEDLKFQQDKTGQAASFHASCAASGHRGKFHTWCDGGAIEVKAHTAKQTKPRRRRRFRSSVRKLLEEEEHQAVESNEVR